MGLSINDYDMILSNDRIVVGVSGGLDSMALLLLLHKRLKRLPIHYDLLPAFVDNWNGENSEHNQRIKNLSLFIERETGLKLHVIQIPAILSLTSGKSRKRDTCFLCAQKRRSALIQYAFEQNCTKIALGHHQDDIIETTLMNMLYKRELSSMLPRLTLFKGKIEIIRPLAYLRKFQIENFIYERKDPAPIFGEVCPSKMVRRDLRRLKVRELLEELSLKIPKLNDNIFAAFRNPHPDYLLNQNFNPKTSGIFRRP